MDEQSRKLGNILYEQVIQVGTSRDMHPHCITCFSGIKGPAENMFRCQILVLAGKKLMPLTWTELDGLKERLRY